MTAPVDRGVLTFRAVSEDQPGPAWQALFEELAPSLERWYLCEGDAARPGFLECERALARWVPELVPVWERLRELAGGGDVASRLLSLWRPPPYVTGCSQAVWPGGPGSEPLLVRNYDYRPDLCERILLRTRWTGRTVVAMSDGLVGVLDGMNDAGLVVSLAFGGRPTTGEGFGAPLLLRYVLETRDTTREAMDVLRRVPVHVAYNVAVLDRAGDYVTAFVAPGKATVLRRIPVSTNHQLRVHWPRHAEATATLERERHLFELVGDPDTDADAFVAAFLKPPLYSRRFAEGFGTLYTAAYRPGRGELELLWPERSWRQGIDDFSEGLLEPLRIDGG